MKKTPNRAARATRIVFANLLLLLVFASANGQLTANFAASNVYPCAGDTVDFTNLSTSATNYVWLENGVPFSNLANPSRQFSTPGAFLVTLVAVNGLDTDSTSTIVQVNPGLGGTLVETDASCFGFSDGALALTPTGGTPNVSLCLDGVDDFVNADSVATFNYSGGITVESWVKPDANWTTGDGMVAAFNSVGGGNHFLFSYNTTIQKFIYFDNVVGNQIPTVTHARGQWHHVAMTITSSNQGRIYVNGILVRQFVTGTTWIPMGGQFSFGQEWDGVTTSQHLNGCMDEARIWNTALTQSTIQDNYNNSCAEIGNSHPNINNLIAYYSFNEGTGAFTFDRSGNNNHGKFNGSIWGAPPGNDFGCFAQGTGFAYDWSNSALTEDLTGLSAGTYTVTMTDGAGCSFVDSATVSEPPQIIASYAASPDTICIGDTTDILTSGAYTFTYSPGGSLSATTGSTVMAFPTTTTTYQIIAEDGVGCMDTSSLTVAVNPLPIPMIVGTDTVCAGTPTTLTASGGTGYAWSTGDATAAITVSPSVDSNYVVVVTDANGCVDSTSQTVTVNALPVVAITGPMAICLGDTAALVATGGGTYAWDNMATTASIQVSPLDTTTYTVVVTDSNNCMDSSSQQVAVNALPVVEIAGDSVICAGDTALLIASGGSQYLWSTAETTSGIGVSPVSATNYSVVGTDANNCSAADSFSVDVNGLPALGVLGQDTLCGGDTTLLMVVGASTYVWSTGDSASSIQDNPLVTTTYSVTGTDTNGCSATATYEVFVHPAPAVMIAGDTVVCDRDSTTLEVSGASTYVWSTGATSSDITVSGAGLVTYSVTGTDLNGCTATTMTTVNFLAPVLPVITDLNGVLSAGPGYASYQWYLDGVLLTGATAMDYNPGPSQSGNYTVVVTDSNGCTGESTPVLGTGDFGFLAGASIYPNPSNGQFTLALEVTRTRDLKVSVTTLHGQRILSLEDRAYPGKWNREVDLGEVSKGLYLVEIESGGTKMVRKLVID